LKTISLIGVLTLIIIYQSNKLFIHYKKLKDPAIAQQLKKHEKAIRDMEALLESGKSTQATYTEVYDLIKGEAWDATYTYVAGETTYTKKIEIGSRPVIGSTFEIYYLPSDPLIHSRVPRVQLEYEKKQLHRLQGSTVLTWITLLAAIAVLLFVGIKHLLRNTKKV
jgi:hypothetical protein